MKKALFFIGFAILAVGAFFIITGSHKASVMEEISTNSMQLLADTSAITDFDAKLYDIAYSLPVGSEKVGLWLEAVISKKFETFSTQSQLLTPELAKKLQGWPIDYTVEIDLSGSDTAAETMLLLGDLSEAEWIDLSRTQVNASTLEAILERAPKLQKLQLNETAIEWVPKLVDLLLAHPQLIEVEVDALEGEELQRLNQGLAQ